MEIKYQILTSSTEGGAAFVIAWTMKNISYILTHCKIIKINQVIDEIDAPAYHAALTH